MKSLPFLKARKPRTKKHRAENVLGKFFFFFLGGKEEPFLLDLGASDFTVAFKPETETFNLMRTQIPFSVPPI